MGKLFLADAVEVHYRVFAEDSPVPLLEPAYSNDMFLGRIPATSVTPPHTIANIKHYLRRVEEISSDTPADLFTVISGDLPADDTEYVRILDINAPGSKPSEPMALVIKSANFEIKAPLKKTKIKGFTKRSKPVEPRYR